MLCLKHSGVMSGGDVRGVEKWAPVGGPLTRRLSVSASFSGLGRMEVGLGAQGLCLISRFVAPGECLHLEEL